MKGLLIKDFKLLKNQKNFFILVFVMAAFLTITNGAGSSPATFVLPYVGFVSSFFVLSTISYDEYDNGNAFLLRCPLREKYTRRRNISSVLCQAERGSSSSWPLSLCTPAGRPMPGRWERPCSLPE